jgi:hypothetical protein
MGPNVGRNRRHLVYALDNRNEPVINDYCIIGKVQ